jgi:hypothetical protein
MLKFNGLILTLALAFFSLFLSEAQSDLAFKQNTANHHDLKIDHYFNTFAISSNNSFQELVNFDKEKNQPNQNYFYAKNLSNEVVFKSDLQYLKVCGFLDLNFTTRNIIYPFHSFL